MIENLDTWISPFFLAIWVITIWLFYMSNGKPKKLLLLIIVWSVLHTILAWSGFFLPTQVLPPRLAIAVFPPLFFMLIYGLRPKSIEWVLKNRKTQVSTFLHTIRIPVEIVLFQLFLHKMIPQLMTFEGRNFDIIIGITAPIVGLLYLNNNLSKKVLLGWNIIGLFFVFAILLNALFAVESPIQLFAFDQPNRAVLYFPFILLPAVIVPIVIYTQLTDIIKLRREIKQITTNN